MVKVWLITGSSRGLGRALARIEADRKWRELSVATDFSGEGGANPFPWEKR
jgi:NAD(P)-dependent dehydrogenase (short-subunit alcohol dehydrogenase family)